MPSLSRVLLAEALGTFILVLFGCGAVHSAVTTGAQVGLWQVAIVWGLAVMFASYVAGGVSDRWAAALAVGAVLVAGRVPSRPSLAHADGPAPAAGVLEHP